MNEAARTPLGRLVLIAVVLAAIAAAFAYTAGWLSPRRLTPDKMVNAFDPSGHEPLGHRRNHAKGICFTGTFDANGAGSALSRARVFASGRYPAVGRFNLGTPDPNAADASVRVRGMGLRISTPDGREWRTAMINAPFFPVSTPQAFYELLLTVGSKDAEAIKRFAGAHPSFAAYGAWAQSAPWTGSYAEERYNSLNSFVFSDNAGGRRTVRWSFLPAAQAVAVTSADLTAQGADVLEREITERVRSGPVRFSLIITLANPGDPTNDPSRAWPPERQSIAVGTLVIEQIQAERFGPCRDINFDPTVLPPGMATSDDPFPAARSSAYAKSFDRRTAETAYYPGTATVAP